MPRDLFAERGIKIDQPMNGEKPPVSQNQPRDLFAERGIKPPEMQSKSNSNRFPDFKMENYPKFQEHMQQTGREAVPGAAQGFLNSLLGLANLAPGVNIPKTHFAPNTPVAKQGETAGELASYFVPGKALKAIPGVTHALQGMESMPIRNALLKLLGHSAEGAAFGAAQAPEGNKGLGALEGAGFGGGGNLLAQMMRNKNPFFGALMRAGLGAGLGAAGGAATGYGPVKGAAAGAGAGIFAPSALEALSGRGKPGMETLEHLTQQEVAPSMAAARRLGTPITPAEASGNPYVGGVEGRYGRTGEASAEKTAIGMERVNQQKSAVNDLLDTIYDKSTPQAAAASKAKVANLYTQANQWSIKPQVVDQFKADPVIASAFERVKKDPAYRRKLNGVAENSYAYLNQVKRAISDMEGAALKAGEKDRAGEFKAARDDLLHVMDTSVPAYKAAREEAQKSIIRSNIQKAMKKKEIKGSTFYNTVLKNDEEFTKLRNDLKNVPEAQDKLDDMRLAWKDLINIEKPRNSHYLTEKGINQSRNSASKLVDMWNEMTGAKRNIAALKFIHSPDWDKEFSNIQAIKDAAKRNDAIVNLLGRISSASATEKAVK